MSYFYVEFDLLWLISYWWWLKYIQQQQNKKKERSIIGQFQSFLLFCVLFDIKWLIYLTDNNDNVTFQKWIYVYIYWPHMI